MGTLLNHWTMDEAHHLRQNLCVWIGVMYKLPGGSDGCQSSPCHEMMMTIDQSEARDRGDRPIRGQGVTSDLSASIITGSTTSHWDRVSSHWLDTSVLRSHSSKRVGV